MMLSKLTRTELVEQAKRIVPPLLPSLHKGQAGRIAVIGGCEDYTGAPFFSAHAAALLGVDLTHVICEESAAPVIKSYSPDLMVHPYLRDSSKYSGSETEVFLKERVLPKVKQLLQRMHCVVIGPGFGRDPLMLQSLHLIIAEVKRLELPVILDADSLFLVSQKPELIRGYSKAILTPNVVEFARLCDALSIDAKSQSAAEQLSAKLGVVVLQKGTADTIVFKDQSIKVDLEGSNKRVGGQGDSLTGLICGFVAWGIGAYSQRLYPESLKQPYLKEHEILMLACFAGSTVNRSAANLAFQKHGRAMQTSNIHESIPLAYRDLFE